MPAWGIYSNAASEHRDATSQTSTLCRNTAYGLLATIWLYAGGLSSDGEFDTTLQFVQARALLRASFALILLCIAVDFLQYVVATGLWGWWRRKLHLLLGPHAIREVKHRSDQAWSSSYVGRFLRTRIEASSEYAALGRRSADPWDFDEISKQLRHAGSGAGPLDTGRFPGWFNAIITGLFWLKNTLLVAALATLVVELV